MHMFSEKIKFECYYFIYHTRLFTPLRYLFFKKNLRPSVEETVQDFGKPFTEELCRDMIWKWCAHLITMPQYFLFDCASRSYAEIEEFLGNREIRYWASKVNDPSKVYIFSNKYETYRTFEKYYARKVIRAVSKDDLPEFIRFALSHEALIVKPIDMFSGFGVMRVCADTERKATAVFNMMLSNFPKGFVAEEPVVQCAEMAAFHPQSVNTVRLATIRHDDHVRIWHPFFRSGRGDSVVDNAGAGGVETLVDPETGILGAADDMVGNFYETHPDTGHQLRGYRIPRWDEALALAKELAQVVPEVRYVGWDLALTDEGWVVIEGNSAAHMGQNIEKTGWKREFQSELKKIKQHH